MVGIYQGYQFTYEEIDGKIVVSRAYYCGIQCSYGQTFDSMEDLKKYIDDGNWSAGER